MNGQISKDDPQDICLGRRVLVEGQPRLDRVRSVARGVLLRAQDPRNFRLTALCRCEV
jgi:hypothetical protein